VNAATKLLFSQNEGNFLTRRETAASLDELCYMAIVFFFTNVEMFGKYEDWNFNSGNYLFTTDTK